MFHIVTHICNKLIAEYKCRVAQASIWLRWKRTLHQDGWCLVYSKWIWSALWSGI